MTKTQFTTTPAHDLKGGDHILVNGKVREVFDTDIRGTRVNARYLVGSQVLSAWFTYNEGVRRVA